MQRLCLAVSVGLHPPSVCGGDKLLLLRQGGRSVTDYVKEFGTLAAESGWNEHCYVHSEVVSITPWGTCWSRELVRGTRQR